MDQVFLPLIIFISAVTNAVEANPIAVNAHNSTTLNGIGSRVYGGNDALPGAWPWQLAVEYFSSSSWQFRCGAVLIRTDRGLTAANCVTGTGFSCSSSTLRIVAGRYQTSVPTGTQTVQVSSCVPHVSYNNGPASSANDIAILKFLTPVTLNANVDVISLPADNSNDFSGSNCVITGWGGSTSSTNSDKLQEAVIPVITTSVCQLGMTTVTGGITIWNGHICVKDPQSVSGTCNGDIGGPLNCQSGAQYVLTGILSFSIFNSNSQTCLPNYPSVYTRIGYYLSWISSNI